MALGAKVPAWVWAELAESPEEAELLEYRNQAARREARLLAKYGYT